MVIARITYITDTVRIMKIMYNIVYHRMYWNNVYHRHTIAGLTRPAKINHLSTFFVLLYHNFITIYITTTKFSSLMRHLMGFLLQLTELGYYALNERY